MACSDMRSVHLALILLRIAGLQISQGEEIQVHQRFWDSFIVEFWCWWSVWGYKQFIDELSQPVI